LDSHAVTMPPATLRPPPVSNARKIVMGEILPGRTTAVPGERPAS
jgi:hypothetical protein